MDNTTPNNNAKISMKEPAVILEKKTTLSNSSHNTEREFSQTYDATNSNLHSNSEYQIKGDAWELCRQKTRSEPSSNMIAGGVGGITSLVVGYPFDTVKVRLQTDDKNIYKGGIDCCKQIIFKEGPFSFFRGMSGLFIFSTPRLALIFYGNSIGLKFLRGDFGDDKKRRESGNEIGSLLPSDKSIAYKPSLKEIFVAGILSQIAAVPLVTQPCERIKILLQIQPPDSTRSQLQCLREVIMRDGLRNGLYRGTLLTYARDIPSFSTYFLTYEVVRSYLSRHTSLHEPKRSTHSRILGNDIWITLTAGSCAGLIGWAVAIPFDVVKNRHQAVIKGSMFSTIVDLWKKERLSGFYRGAIPILVRAIPANAAAFLGYETAISVITQSTYNEEGSYEV